MPRQRAVYGPRAVMLRRLDGTSVSAAELGAALRGRPLRGVSEFIAELVGGNSPLEALLDLVLAVRVFQRPARPRTTAVAIQELRSGHPSRWVMVAMQQCFGMYTALRRAAVPMAVPGTSDSLF